ncbi:MAG: restriction endonuclease subunit S, partial [Bacteroidetes bacterium]|nr:restriction endonuclease subunit S [Bacteroidota bacterium]
MMEGWKIIEIDKIVLKTKLKDPTKNPDNHFYYVDVSSVSNTLFKITEPNYITGKEAPSRARKLIQTDDIIFATVRPTLKRIAYG